MDENKFYKYVDDKSILVITPKNKLIRIHCPFAVTSQDNAVLQVDKVLGHNAEIYFQISGKYVIHNVYKIVTT